MARHGANYASPCRLNRLRATKMARPGTSYYGNKLDANVRLALGVSKAMAVISFLNL